MKPKEAKQRPAEVVSQAHLPLSQIVILSLNINVQDQCGVQL